MDTEELVVLAEPEGVEPRSGPAAMSESDRRERLREMVLAHHATTWRFLRRLGLAPSDADDAMQDVLLVVMRKLDVIEPASERSFLLRTAYRVGTRLRARPRASSELLLDSSAHPDALLDQKRARELLDHILAAMKEELRTVFVLHDIERLTMAEIAEVIEAPPGTVASRLRRAREDFDKRVTRVERRMMIREKKA